MGSMLWIELAQVGTGHEPSGFVKCGEFLE